MERGHAVREAEQHADRHRRQLGLSQREPDCNQHARQRRASFRQHETPRLAGGVAGTYRQVGEGVGDGLLQIVHQQPSYNQEHKHKDHPMRTLGQAHCACAGLVCIPTIRYATVSSTRELFLPCVAQCAYLPSSMPCTMDVRSSSIIITSAAAWVTPNRSKQTLAADNRETTTGKRP